MAVPRGRLGSDIRNRGERLRKVYQMATFHGWNIAISTSTAGRKRATASKKGKHDIFVEGRAEIDEAILHERLEDEVLAEEVRSATNKADLAKYQKLRDEANLTKRVNNRIRGIERAMRDGATTDEALQGQVVASSK